MEKRIYYGIGANIYYEIKGQGKSVIFLHAGIADRRMWDREFDKFSSLFKCIRIDLPGYGYSDFTGESYSYVKIIKGPFEHIEIDKAVIVAASFGGKIALDFILADPEMCSGAILAAPAVSGWKNSDFLNSMELEEDKLYEEGNFEAVAKLNYDTWVQAGRDNNKINPQIKTLILRMQLDAYSKSNEEGNEIESSDIIPQLSTISTPMKILIGDKDVLDFQKIADLICEKTLCSQKVVVHNTADLINLEQPEIFENESLSFLNQIM